MAVELLRQANVALARLKDETLTEAARLEAFRVVDATIAELAGLPCSSSERRQFAQHMDGEVLERFRVGLPELTRTLTDFALAAGNAVSRREASEILEGASHKLRELGRELEDLRVDVPRTTS